MTPLRPYLLPASWLLLSLLAGGVLLLAGFSQQRSLFQQNSSIAHRLLSQKMVQHEAVLATLALQQRPPPAAELLAGLRPAMPQLLALGLRQDGRWLGSDSTPPPLAATLARARQQRRIQTQAVGVAQYWLVAPSGWSLLLDSRRLLAASEWPATLQRVQLQLPGGNSTLLSQPMPAWGWSMTLDKPLPTSAQLFTFHSQQRYGIAQWPWLSWLAVSTALALLLAWQHSRRQARQQAQREREQARLAAVSRLSTLGEMAAGMAHELNQPLTAILANLRACQRLLDDDDERDTVRQALASSAAQAKRAGDIIARLRALVTQQAPRPLAAIDSAALLASVQDLRQAELAALGIRLHCLDASAGRRPLADNVALEQIVHNLLQNAVDALAGQPGSIEIRADIDAGRYRLQVSDSGPGIAEADLPQLFQPFFSTKPGGMGLGLSLCETLAHSLHGQLTAANLPAGGACFTLSLPLADEETP
ncbi:sensor histidine kinase [Vogesella indigofera]|uniref:sensor histidine kinase n=1 Tax=Vogesella indigofera TaxID=45465 RepID=UPI00234CC2BB|nr:ATP-binding protein [Vogesella indigofera]MDC7704752.1 ATP-binding protein [Vogesella indigofera]